jgi:hypothetical protein
LVKESAKVDFIARLCGDSRALKEVANLHQFLNIGQIFVMWGMNCQRLAIPRKYQIAVMLLSLVGQCI